MTIGRARDRFSGGQSWSHDNGSGVAAVLALARAFAGKESDRPWRFV